MTRAFRTLIMCPRCGAEHSAESAFERWMRDHPALGSREAGIVRFDCDVLLHKYARHVDKKSERTLQCVMFVEVKTFGADVTPAQRDTLSMFSQVLINRRRNRHAPRHGRHADDHIAPAVVTSLIQGGPVRLRLFGGHLLRLADADPVTSAWMRWNGAAITCDQLVSLLRFDLDPHTLRPIDWRRRYSSFETSYLWDAV